MRDMLLRMAASNIVHARWSDKILDECFDAILRKRPDLQRASLLRTRDLMNSALPECMVRNYEHLISTIQLPDDKDRHVLAAAMKCHAECIITLNIRDFPRATLADYSMKAVHPDTFVFKHIERDSELMQTIIIEQARALRRPSITIQDLLHKLHACGLATSSARLRSLLSL